MGTLPKSGSATVEVAATPEQVWALLTDITRAGEWSHETQGGEWLDGATAAVPGARFRGRNQQGRTKWSRVCEVVVADAPRTISWRTVPTRVVYRDSTRWTYELTPTDTGCTVTQRFEVLQLGPVVDRIFYAIVPAHRDRSAALAGDLRSLGEVASRKVAEPAT
jgi:uncharacterized protein YndB with AHSA1/START domain